MQDNYLQEIETTFSKIRGKGLVLSAIDFQLVQSWQENGIPLRIVLRAMDDVHKNFQSQNRPDKINSLSYFTQAVEKEFANWQKTQVGKNKENEMEEIQLHPLDAEIKILRELEDSYKSADFPNEPFKSAINVVVKKLSKIILKANDNEISIEQIEKELRKMNNNLQQSMVNALNREERERIIDSVHAEFLTTKMTDKARINLVNRRMYEHFNLTELTLYKL